MERLRPARKWVLALASCALLGACGDEPAKPTAPADPELAKRCDLTAIDGDGGFPAGLLPERAVVTAEGTAIAVGKLAAVYAALQDRAAAAGLTVRDTELETLDAEVELEGPDGELGLRL
ncbi:MAG: hypothetical protein QOI80_773, partial [Solirubrobacteraceae bacterium]|nr:hypothetical protein [Solirubrobacteraceae bacterium]